MIKRVSILLSLLATIALPFLLQPKQRAPENADDTLVIITPHNEAIRREFGAGFRRWYQAKTGRTVALDWRVIGGTSDIARFLESEYVAAFESYWTRERRRRWSAEVQAAFANGRLGPEATPEAREAREAFLASTVGCGIDLFFGGGAYDFILQADAGRIVPSRIRATHPEWFGEAVVPETYAGERYWDSKDRWVGNVLSNYGILFNRDALKRLGIATAPQAWRDLTDGRYLGQVALADPTKSSSIAKAFENVVQQEMQRRRTALSREDPARAARDPQAIEAQAVREGWIAGLQVLQLIGANARYFTDTSQKPPIDVAQGDCAAGVCIDFYGRAQAEVAARRSGGEGRLGFATPRGGTVSSVDPIAILRGAPHRDVAEAFIEFTLSMEGQKLWNFRPGTPGGPEQFALRRLPVRRDFYAHTEWQPLRSDPTADPYGDEEQLISQPAWTGGLFRELAFIVRVMVLDTHPELARAWRAIQTAPEPAKSQALEALQDLSAVSYERAGAEIKRALGAKNRVEEIELARKLAEQFRRNYAEAEELARNAR